MASLRPSCSGNGGEMSTKGLKGLKAEIERRRPELVALRRHFHMHPELAFEEHETARTIAKRLRAIGFNEVTEGVGQTGVVGLLRGTTDHYGAGRTLLIRADID